MYQGIKVQGDRTILRRVCLAPFCTNIFTVGEGGTAGREKRYCCSACRKAASRAKVFHTPFTKRQELGKMHNDHFEKVRRLMKEAQQAADMLDVIADSLEVNGGDCAVYFQSDIDKREYGPVAVAPVGEVGVVEVDDYGDLDCVPF